MSPNQYSMEEKKDTENLEKVLTELPFLTVDDFILEDSVEVLTRDSSSHHKEVANKSLDV